MWNSARERWTLVGVYGSVHAAVILSFWWEGRWREYPQIWNRQYLISILLLMLIACFMLFLKSVALRQALFLVRVLLTAVSAVPSASHPGSFGLLYIILIFDGFVHCPGFIAYLTGLSCLAYLTVLAYSRVSVWFRPAEPIDLGALISTWVECLLALMISLYLTREQRLHRRDLAKQRELRVFNQYLADTNIKLQDIAAQVESATVLKERNRIAREIHDTVAYTMTNLLSLLDAYRERLQSASQPIPEELIQARALVRDGLGDVRLVLRGLRPREEAGTNGLGMIWRLVKVFSQATGIAVQLEYGDAPQYPGKNEAEVFYRVVQEGLTNAFRHGQATEVFVYFYRLRDGIGLTIRDNGRGTETFTGGFGLLGIKERVEALGGSVAIASQVGNGFTLRVWLPLRTEDDTVHGATTIGDRG